MAACRSETVSEKIKVSLEYKELRRHITLTAALVEPHPDRRRTMHLEIASFVAGLGGLIVFDLFIGS